jgi:hypothetical protein
MGLGITITRRLTSSCMKIDHAARPVLPAGPVADERGLAWSEERQLVLALEVLSPASLPTDRVTKRDVGRKSGVAEYWIVDLESRLFERWPPTVSTPQAVMFWVLLAHRPRW